MKSKNFELKRGFLYYNRELILKDMELTDAWVEFEKGKVPEVCNEHSMSSGVRSELWDFLTQAIVKGKCVPKKLRDEDFS